MKSELSSQELTEQKEKFISTWGAMEAHGESIVPWRKFMPFC